MPWRGGGGGKTPRGRAGKPSKAIERSAPTAKGVVSRPKPARQGCGPWLRRDHSLLLLLCVDAFSASLVHEPPGTFPEALLGSKMS